MAAPRKTPILAVSMGDPAGIGAEVILKAAAAIVERRNAPVLIVIGDLESMTAAASRIGRGVPTPYEWDCRSGAPKSGDGLAVRSMGRLGERARRPGRPSIAGTEAAFRYVVEGARTAIAGEVDALVTAPINKEWMNRAGHCFPGHSELLAELAHTKLWRMMFVGEALRLALVTVHIGLAEVPRRLTRAGIFHTIRLLAEHLRDRVRIATPRIAVLGLNPHAGEGGLFGDEEKRIIGPAIRDARRRGIDVLGPVAPDTAFIRRRERFEFDGAVAMYHDQGLIALKTLEFDRAVNITLGLPFVRTSPDHGTAYDIAGRGVASGASMAAAIEYAARAVASGKLPGKSVRKRVRQSAVEVLADKTSKRSYLDPASAQR
jgi:4-hydroxythreonine-4-phosphate dehydrogenase